MQCFLLGNFRIKMTILKLTGAVRMGSGETVVKPQCDIKYLTLSFIGAWRCERGGERAKIEMKELEHRKEKDTIFYYSCVIGTSHNRTFWCKSARQFKTEALWSSGPERLKPWLCPSKCVTWDALFLMKVSFFISKLV